MPILELREVTKRFGQTIALQSVDLSLETGRVHALIGENGAGKSTMMNIVSGAIRPDSGSMTLRQSPYSPTDTQDARRKGIALIHQELSLAPHLTVTENILLGNEMSRFGWIDRKASEQSAIDALNNFDHPDIRPKMVVGRLSTAARQVVEICRALASGAKIILMDEPTSSLQRDDVRRLFKVIRKLKSDGITIVYISHFLEEVRELADDFTILRDGKNIVSGQIADVTDEFIISKMVGRSVEKIFPKRDRPPEGAEVALGVRGLSAPPLLKDATFELRSGEILGIAGLIGAGRTAMVRALFGIDEPASGEVLVRGTAVSARGGNPTFRLLQGIGYVSEDRKDEGLALDLSIADNVTITRFDSCSRMGWLNLGEQNMQSEKLMAELAVKASSASQTVRTLSGGNQQKVAIARLLHQRADVLLLDEPTRGIDIGSKTKIYEAIASLADQGKAILMISSYLPELFGMCDRLAVMTRGRLSPTRPIEKWTPELVLNAAISAAHNEALADANGY